MWRRIRSLAQHVGQCCPPQLQSNMCHLILLPPHLATCSLCTALRARSSWCVCWAWAHTSSTATHTGVLVCVAVVLLTAAILSPCPDLLIVTTLTQLHLSLFSTLHRANVTAVAHRLVLQPVQRMVERVREMAEDPLMLAAVRNTPAMSLSSSGDAASSSNSGGNGAAATTRSSRSLALPHGGGEKQSAIVRASTMAPAAGLDSNKAATTASSKIRFWPSVRVHAVAEGMDAASPGSGASTPLKGSGVVQQRQQLFPPSATAASAAGAEASLPPPRVSGTQLVVAQARRLSAHLVAGVSAAGRAADRLRLQLLQRTTAIKSLLTASDEDDEAGDTAGGQGQYETRLLEQSIYKICALLAVGFGDAGAEVIAENIKQEGDLNPCMPGKKTVGSIALFVVMRGAVWRPSSSRPDDKIYECVLRLSVCLHAIVC